MTTAEAKKIEEIENMMPAGMKASVGFRLAEHRSQAYMYLSMVLVVILIPFTFHNFYNDHTYVGLSSVLVVALLASNIMSMQLRQRLLFAPVVTSLSIILALVVSISQLGYVAIFWAYPIVCMLFFIHERKVASLYSLTLLIIIAPLVFQIIDLKIMIRFYVSLMLTGMFINMMVYIIEQQQRSLQRLIITDPLTGVLNRRCLNESMKNAQERHQRNHSKETMVMMDIDHFKGINDNNGHECGDEVLIKLVEIIKSRLRKLDMLFRYGGDEFIILLNETNAVDAGNLAEELRQLVEQSEEDKVTISMGVAELKPDESTIDWMSRCDQALYEAKLNGRNQVSISS